MTLAWEELAQSRNPGDPDRQMAIRRQAAEKAWVFVTSSVDRILGIHETGPEAHRERWNRLRRLGEDRLLLDYGEIQRVLHGDCFYSGNCPFPEVERLIRTAAEFPERVRRAAGGRMR